MRKRGKRLGCHLLELEMLIAGIPHEEVLARITDPEIHRRVMYWAYRNNATVSAVVRQTEHANHEMQDGALIIALLVRAMDLEERLSHVLVRQASPALIQTFRAEEVGQPYRATFDRDEQEFRAQSTLG